MTGGVTQEVGRPKEGAPGVEGPRRGALGARGLKERLLGTRWPASWSLASWLLSASCSACWRVFTLVRQVFALASRFWRCFSLFSYLFLFRRSSSLSSSSLSTVIASSILTLLSQSKPVDPVQSLPSVSNSALGAPSSKSLVGPMCMWRTRRIPMVIIEAFSAPSRFRSFSMLLVVKWQ